jgi:predicted HTH domain antitoxin
MQGLNIEIPGEIVATMKLPGKRIKEHLLIDIAASLYQQEILSFGKARQLCNLSKWEFQKELGIRKVERHYDEKDLEEDIKFAHSKTER